SSSSFLHGCNTVACSSHCASDPRHTHSSPTRRSSDLGREASPCAASAWVECRFAARCASRNPNGGMNDGVAAQGNGFVLAGQNRSEEHTSELQSRENLVCRLLLEKKKQRRRDQYILLL